MHGKSAREFFVCSLCGKHFQYKNSLVVHLGTHQFIAGFSKVSDMTPLSLELVNKVVPRLPQSLTGLDDKAVPRLREYCTQVETAGTKFNKPGNETAL